MRIALPLILSLLLLPVSLAADSEGVIVRTAKLYQQANPASPLVGQIRAGSRVSIFSRKGGWKEVFSADKNLLGWLRSYQVREGNFTQAPEAKKEPDDRGILGGLASFSRKASSFFNIGGGATSSSTATIGVRGLSKEQIESAEPDIEQLERMQGYASDPGRAAKFGSAGKLRSSAIDYLESSQAGTDQPRAVEK